MNESSSLIRKSTDTVDSLPLSYYHNQREDNAIIFLHGAGSDHALFCWKKTLPYIGKSRAVYAPDLPGYGESPWPVASPRKSPVWYYRDVILEWIEHLGLRQFSIAGLSMGGALALSILQAVPERINKLILVASYGLGKEIPSHLSFAVRMNHPLLQQGMRRLLRLHPAVVKQGIRVLVDNHARKDQELITDAWQTILRQKTHPAWDEFLHYEVGRNGYQTSFVDFFEHISQPTLIVHGKQDRLVFPGHAMRAAEKIPCSKLLMFPECGHLPPREHPQKFNEALENFLNE